MKEKLKNKPQTLYPKPHNSHISAIPSILIRQQAMGNMEKSF